jgi:hypothetical protein
MDALYAAVEERYHPSFVDVRSSLGQTTALRRRLPPLTLPSPPRRGRGMQDNSLMQNDFLSLLRERAGVRVHGAG